MAFEINQPALNLRAFLARVAGLEARMPRRTAMFWFEGDGAATDFTLKPGFRPVWVAVDGAIYRPGGAEDYTVAGGSTFTISFAVAPGTVDVAVFAEAVQ